MNRSGSKDAPPSPLTTFAWFAFLTIAAAVPAYYRTFTGFQEWDDEGTLLMMVRQYVTGSQLYREIFSGYGPVYFFVNGLWRHLTGIAVDHNSTRVVTVAISLLVTLICAWTVLRMTRSLAAATVTHLVVFRALLFFTNEPGHPQELCLLFLVGIAACAVVRPVTWGLALAGALAAGLTLIKVNIGVFAVAAIALSLVFQMPGGLFWRTLRYAAAAAAIAMPLMLMRVHMNDAAAQTYCLLVTLSMAGVLGCVARFDSRDTIGILECLAAGAGFLVAFGGSLLLLAAQGVSLADAYTFLITNQLKMNVSPGFWYSPIELHRAWILWAATGAGLALWVSAQRRLPGPPGVLQVACGGAGLLLGALAPSTLLGFTTPFCWLLLCPREEPEGGRNGHARLLLAALAVVQTLTAYPMPGSQAYFLRIPLLLVTSVVLMDGVRAAHLERFARPAMAAVLAGVTLAYPLLGYRAKRQYDSMVSLNQPGAEWVHVEPELAYDYQWMVTNLRRNCDTFVALPGLPSLYFWTGKPMPGRVDQLPGPLNMDQWMDLFTPAQQLNIAADLARHPDACAINHPSGVDFWNTGNHQISDWPLAAYMMANFKPIGQSGDYQFMVRKQRDLTIPAGVQRPAVGKRRR